MATIPRMGKVPAIATYAATGIAFGVVTTVWRHIEKGAPLGALLSLEALARTTFAAVFFCSLLRCRHDNSRRDQGVQAP
jgi:hypothetical protein